MRGSSRPCRPIGRSTRTRKPLANGRCPNHGGFSSGPKTAEGRERIAEAQRARWTRWRSKRLLKGLKGALLLAVLFSVWLGIYRIDAGHVGVVKRFGNVIAVADPGLHVKIPYADTVEEIEVRERAFTMNLEAASQYPLELPIVATINWLVKRSNVKDLYIQFGTLAQFENRIILPRLNDAVKGITVYRRLSIS